MQPTPHRTPPLQGSERRLWVSISICDVCDKDRDPLEVPDKACGHSWAKHQRTVAVEVVPRADAEALEQDRDFWRESASHWRRLHDERAVSAEALAEALEDISRRPSIERNPDGDDQAADTMKLIAAETLAVYRAKHPTRVGESGDATTKPASELERGPKETT